MCSGRRSANLLLVAALWALPALSLKAHTFQMRALPLLPGSETSAWHNYREEATPIIEWVRTQPAVVEAGAPFTLEAKVYADPSLSGTELDTVTVLIRGASSRWEEMEPHEEQEDVWVLEMSPLAEEVVSFYLRATDTAGNTTVQVPLSAGEVSADAWQLWVEDADEEDSLVRESLDVVRVEGAASGTTLHLRITLAGEVTEGTLDPAFMHAYGAIVWNGVVGDDLLASYLTGYVPLFRYSHYPQALVYDVSRRFFDADAAVPYEVEGSTLTLHVPRRALGPATDRYRLVFGTLGLLTIRARENVSAVGRPTGALDFLESIIAEWREKTILEVQDLDVVRERFFFSDLSPYLSLEIGGLTLKPVRVVK